MSIRDKGNGKSFKSPDALVDVCVCGEEMDTYNILLIFLSDHGRWANPREISSDNIYETCLYLNLLSILGSDDKIRMMAHNKTGRSLNIPRLALAGLAQWIDYWPTNQRFISLIPSLGTCLGWGPGPKWGGMWETTTHWFFFLSLFLPPFLSFKIIFFYLKNRKINMPRL